jgi:hypothetical protein
VLLSDVFYAEVVDDEGERNGARVVAPQGEGPRDGAISERSEMLGQAVIRDASGLFQTGHSLPYLHVDPAFGVCKGAKVIFVDDFVWNVG